MKILVIKFRHIGDVLLSTSLIKNLKLNYPNAQIDYVLNKDCAEMVSHNPFINKIFSYDRKEIRSKNFIKRLIEEYYFIKSIISNKYDLVINLTEGDRGAIISKLSKAKIRLGIRSKNRWVNFFLKPYTTDIIPDYSVHTIEKDLKFIDAIGGKIFEKKAEIFYSNEDEKSVKEICKQYDLNQFIIVHPVSRWLFKCWDNNKFAKVIDYIQKEMQIPVVITASPAPKELQIVNDLLGKCHTKPINLAGKLSLKKLAALISKSDLFLGVDTAPMHMAAALEIPVIALFGSSDPKLWGPWDNELEKNLYKNDRTTQYNGKHTIIQHENDKIIYKNGAKISTALMSITVEEVIGEIKRRFRENGNI
ncbi:putative lipopolysaccharide heptosyltransferase III [Hydrogenimonas thermophila]|uniref:putative lipopolysaccharide heptosyltransferase III n=1 Tax=Hydrogenimonas thermophila TaxID=223786 RepID=UPI002936F061|nr:putative lipopolysaccharide heptosyltransferase III [Hydrogenimonas thermophila]WOE70345.1 putative lipopolysaccharide heptosyltransferase III [Hydrogenimonas thermophila]WOE72862.1 putative lipopolysaccharide heptosyltransferase III [Hydrogenimonas thermophila]